MPRPLRVFLCHASQDKPAVWRLHRYLKQHGVQPWLDQADLLPGEDWQVEIPKAIKTSDIIIVCLSKNSVNKEGMVQKEITFALDKAQEKPEGTIFVIPVKLEQCDAPDRLNRYQWVDLFRQDGYRRLLMGLNKRTMGLGPDVTQVLMPDETRPKPTRKLILSDQVNGNKAVEKTEPEKLVEAIERADYEAMERAELQQAILEAEKQATRLKTERDAREKAEREAHPPLAPALSVTEGQGQGQREGKPIQKKPFTKVLAPSSLFPQRKLPSKGNDQSARKLVPSRNARLFSIGGIAFIVLVLGGFGLDYLIKNWTVPISPLVTPSALSNSAPPTATPGIGSTMISEKDGTTLLYVPAGEFLMGSTDADTSAGTDEKPQHSVTLDAFWIDQTEVTNKQYAACVNAGKCDPPSSADHFDNSSYANHPVVYVSWNDANAFCSWAGRQLPTEAQWEKAARGTDGSIYPWGAESPSVSLLNYSGNVGGTTEVGAYPDGASVYGAMDMAGNVWEWLADWYDSGYYQNSPPFNPSGPDSGKYRVLRGGSWFNFDILVRSASRDRNDPTYSNYFIGFRCSHDATP